VTQNEGDALLGAEVGQPVPAEQTLDVHDQIVTVRSDDLEETIAVAFEVAVDQGFLRLVQDADVHRSGVQVDTAVVAVLPSVESHRGLLSIRSLATRKPTPWAGVRGPRISIRAVERTETANSAVPARSPPSTFGGADRCITDKVVLIEVGIASTNADIPDIVQKRMPGTDTRVSGPLMAGAV
jgi:hypothetical protein